MNKFEEKYQNMLTSEDVLQLPRPNNERSCLNQAFCPDLANTSVNTQKVTAVFSGKNVSETSAMSLLCILCFSPPTFIMHMGSWAIAN